MGYRYALASISFAASLLAGAPTAALAQCRLCDSPTTGFEETPAGSAIQLQVETSLDFDRLVLLGAGDGEATLLPTGQRSSTGSVATVGAGAMVGSVTIRGEPGRFEGLDLELLDSSGTVAASARTDYDGYFLFDGVAYGNYRVRLAAASAEVAGMKADLDLQATVSDGRPVVRLGSISLQPRPVIASAQ